MSVDSEGKDTSASQDLFKELLAKCGRIVPSLTGRGRQAVKSSAHSTRMKSGESEHMKRKQPEDDQPASAATSKLPISRSQPSQEMSAPKGTSFKDFLDARTGDDKLLQARGALVEEENRAAWDFDARNRELSGNERHAAAILRELREYERRRVFGNLASEDVPGKETLEMGGQFLTNKERIEQRSVLFNAAKAVPKGALLHLHFNAELNPELLLVQAREMQNMFVWSLRHILTTEDLKTTEIIFNIMPDNTPSNNIFAEGYNRSQDAHGSDYQPDKTSWKNAKRKGNVWMRWTDFMARFPVSWIPTYQCNDVGTTGVGHNDSSAPGKVPLNPVENWVLQKMVLSVEEAYDPSQTVNGIWARFNQATRCFKGLMNYQRVYEWYIDAAIDKMIDDKIMYAELRPMLLDKSIPSDDGMERLDNAIQMQLLLDGVEKKKRALEQKGQGHLFPFGLKIIYCTPRSIPKAMMHREMQDCIDLKIRYPELICGFDLVGAEDRPNHIGFYYDELVAFQQMCKAKNLSIPFLFHAGETLLDTGGSTDPRNSNLFDAVALNSKRIGHGFALLKHPQLIPKFRKREYLDPHGRTMTHPGICVELCPISNELLHLCRNIKEHPYPQLLAAGIPCTVNSDNPSLFSNSMSHEFYQIMVGSPTISLYSWKQLALWSIEYSCLDEEQKREGTRLFTESWKEFCDMVVLMYGNLLDGDKLDEAAADAFYGPDRILGAGT